MKSISFPTELPGVNRMLQLLIVEDEPTTREALASRIDWESIGIRVCGQAKNGLDALEKLETAPADLVLTDIRMPRMDGLQLVEEIRRREYDAACVLLSGHNDFPTAQQALRLGVSDFLLKPCSPKEIRSAFEKVASRVLAEKRQAESAQGLQRQLLKNLPLVKSQLLRQWLHAPALATENRLETIDKLRIALSPRDVVVIALQMDNRALERLNYNRTDTELLHLAAANVVLESLEQALAVPVESVTEPGMVLAILNGSTAELPDSKLAAAIKTVRINMDHYLRVSVTAGVSNRTADINRLNEACLEALNALELRFRQGAGGIYFYRDTASPKEVSALESELWQREEAAFEHMKSRLFAEAMNDAEQWLNSLRGQEGLTRSQVRLRATAFLGRLLQLARERGPVGYAIPLDWISLDDQIARTDTMEELSGFIGRVIRQLTEALLPHKKPKRKVQQALKLIAEQYASPSLSLAGVAKSLFVSGSSLSTLFKQELGINFLDYVHQYRIERAKALLQSGDRKIQTVAKEVGYFDEAHFTKTFKKWTGQLPSQYRKQVQGP